jgi:hypothetical protein
MTEYDAIGGREILPATRESTDGFAHKDANAFRYPFP